MKLLTKGILERFAKLGRQEDSSDPIVVAKFFNPTGAEDDSYFEPLSDNYLVHFTRLMELYQSKSEEDLHD